MWLVRHAQGIVCASTVQSFIMLFCFKYSAIMLFCVFQYLYYHVYHHDWKKKHHKFFFLLLVLFQLYNNTKTINIALYYTYIYTYVSCKFEVTFTALQFIFLVQVCH